MHFTPHERFSLTLAAIARNDREEILRLRRSCPQKHYIMPDREYTSKMENLIYVATCFVHWQNYYYTQMTIFSAGMVIEEDETKWLNFQDAYFDQVVRIKSLYEALSLFCKEAQIDYDNLTRLFEPDICISTYIRDNVISKADLDNEFVLCMKEKFLRIWEE